MKSKSHSAASYAPLTPGEIGCFESHRVFWQRVVEGDAPGAYVLEDDMVVASDFQEMAFPESMLEEADIIKVDQSRPKDSAYGTHRIELSKNRYAVRFLGTEISTGCYFVTRKGAKQLLERSKNYFQPVDTFMFDRMSKNFADLNVWKVCEAAAVQIHMIASLDDIGGEFEDRIQGAARPEERRGLLASWRRIRVRARRIIDADTRTMREKRALDYLEQFAKSEPVERKQVDFFSPNMEHAEHVLP